MSTQEHIQKLPQTQTNVEIPEFAVSRVGMAMNDFDSNRHFFGNLYSTLERSPPGSSIENNTHQKYSILP